jgi:hypothetical protein
MKSTRKAELLERLHNPLQLRALVTGSLLLAVYVGMYMPLTSGLAETTRQLNQEQKRLDLARDIEHLRTQVERYKDRLPAARDPNEWVQYVLGGIRGFPLKLVTLDVDTPRDLGPYKAMVVRVELEGAFHDMDSLLRWFESNQRPFRVDSVNIYPHRSGNGTLVMQLTVLGVMG